MWHAFCFPLERETRQDPYRVVGIRKWGTTGCLLAHTVYARWSLRVRKKRCIRPQQEIVLAGEAVETLKRDQRAEAVRATMRRDINPEAS